eukprot:COSAG01_NODE_3893_length_5577_cov_3.387550_2_plen_82_part_00
MAVILVESNARLDSQLVSPSVKPCAVFGRILASGCGARQSAVRAEAVDSALYSSNRLTTAARAGGVQRGLQHGSSCRFEAD